MTYAITAYLTDEQKRRACEATYTPRWKDGKLPRTRDGCRCPMAVALWPDGAESAPTIGHITRRLIDLGQIDETAQHQGLAKDHVGAFVDDWDAGKVADLAEAWGTG